MAPQRVILMSCGSYNPPTNMHLRMFEIARDHLHKMGTHTVVGGIISPVHDGYDKKDLASSSHRCAMLRLALQNSDWIRLSSWETRQNCWTKTRLSLQYHQNLLNSILFDTNEIKNQIQIEDMEWIPENIRNSTDCTPIQIKLLCGADLLESFGIPGLWMEEDIQAIIGQHGLVVITREGSNPNKFIYDSDILSQYMHNICIVTEWISNEISSTRIRRALRRGESVRYLMQDSVIDYVYQHGIYEAKTVPATIKCNQNGPEAAMLYRETYLNRQQPPRSYFYKLESSLRRYGSFHKPKRDVPKPIVEDEGYGKTCMPTVRQIVDCLVAARPMPAPTHRCGSCPTAKNTNSTTNSRRSSTAIDRASNPPSAVGMRVTATIPTWAPATG